MKLQSLAVASSVAVTALWAGNAVAEQLQHVVAHNDAAAAGERSPSQLAKGHLPLLKLHRKLIEIESTTNYEEDVGLFLAEYLESIGLTVRTQVVGSEHSSTSSLQEEQEDSRLNGAAEEEEEKKKKPKKSKKLRRNIYAYPGKSPETKVLLTSHIDTVPPYIPYSTKDDGREIWGRGSVDAKGSVAAMVAAFESLRQEKPDLVKDGSVGLLFVVGEEGPGDGMWKANDLGLQWESVIFGEPTESKLVSGHKGVMLIGLEASGVASHSGYPWLGVSANKILVKALAALDTLADAGGLPASDKFGNTTINIGRIDGGVASNVVPERAEAVLAFRLAAGTPEDTVEIARKTFVKALPGVEIVGPVEYSGADASVGGAGSEAATQQGTKPTGRLEIRVGRNRYAPINLDHDIPGFEPITVNYGTDVPDLLGSHKRYLYGPGSIFVAHGKDEHLTVQDLERAVHDYKKILETTLSG